MNDNEKRIAKGRLLEGPVVFTSRADRTHDVAIVGTLAVILGMGVIGAVATAVDLLGVLRSPRGGINELHRHVEVRQEARPTPR